MSAESPDRQSLLRKVLALVVIMLVGAGGGAIAMRWIDRASQPTLWISEELVDFGVMPPQERASRSFVLRNTGGSKLIIKDMYASCACTDTELPVRELEPGAETVLKVTFTAGDSPYSMATITLSTNDPKQQVRYVELRAQKPWGVDVEPRTLFFTSIGAAQEVIVSTSRDDIFKDGNEVTATSATDFVSTKVVPENKKLRAVVIVRRSDQVVTGAYFSSIQLTDRKGLIKEKIGVQLKGQSQIFLSRPGATISWPSDTESDVSEEVSVMHRTGEPVDVTAIEIHGEAQHILAVDSVRNTESETTITLLRTNNGKSENESGKIRGYVLVSASAGEHEEIFSLPISVSMRPSGS